MTINQKGSIREKGVIFFSFCLTEEYVVFNGFYLLLEWYLQRCEQFTAKHKQRWHQICFVYFLWWKSFSILEEEDRPAKTDIKFQSCYIYKPNDISCFQSFSLLSYFMGIGYWVGSNFNWIKRAIFDARFLVLWG